MLDRSGCGRRVGVVRRHRRGFHHRYRRAGQRTPRHPRQLGRHRQRQRDTAARPRRASARRRAHGRRRPRRPAADRYQHRRHHRGGRAVALSGDNRLRAVPADVGTLPIRSKGPAPAGHDDRRRSHGRSDRVRRRERAPWRDDRFDRTDRDPGCGCGALPYPQDRIDSAGASEGGRRGRPTVRGGARRRERRRHGVDRNRRLARMGVDASGCAARMAGAFAAPFVRASPGLARPSPRSCAPWPSSPRRWGRAGWGRPPAPRSGRDASLRRWPGCGHWLRTSGR